MLPTLTIPSVPLPHPGSEPPSSADSEGGDAFARLLQRAQSGTEATPTHESRGPAAKTADAHGKAAHHPESKRPARDADPQPPTDQAACGDNAALASHNGPAHDDAAAPSTSASDEAPATRPALAITVDPALPAMAAIDPNRMTPQPAADSDDPTRAIDNRLASGRFGVRIGAHDMRSGQPVQARITMPTDGNTSGDAAAAAAALPAHTTSERTVNDVAALAGTAGRAPSFERLPLEATPAASAIVPARDAGSVAGAPRAESNLPQATLHAAIDDAGFGAAVGTQVALWVRDGVQEARLQLHPAELGPVTVQIALDGQAAHVDFTAAVAATRESIEQSLPALAAALRESGFTLAGGSVSGQAGQAGSDGRRERAPEGRADRSRAGADIGGAGDRLIAPRRWTRSLVDVYA
jgi:flagellar hook-length control protein FliK